MTDDEKTTTAIAAIHAAVDHLISIGLQPLEIANVLSVIGTSMLESHSSRAFAVDYLQRAVDQLQSRDGPTLN